MAVPLGLSALTGCAGSYVNPQQRTETITIGAACADGTNLKVKDIAKQQRPDSPAVVSFMCVEGNSNSVETPITPLTMEILGEDGGIIDNGVLVKGGIDTDTLTPIKIEYGYVQGGDADKDQDPVITLRSEGSVYIYDVTKIKRVEIG